MHPKDADGMANSVDPDQTSFKLYICSTTTSYLRLIYIIFGVTFYEGVGCGGEGGGERHYFIAMYFSNKICSLSQYMNVEFLTL